MGTKWLWLSLHWAARMAAVLLAGGFCLLTFGDKMGGRLGWAALQRKLHAPDQLLVEFAAGGVLIVVLGWIWERWGSRADVMLASLFAVCCILIGGAHPVWLAAVALLVPVALFWLDAKRSARRQKAGALGRAES